MRQTSVPETLVIHQNLTPGYNPKTFKQHYDHGGKPSITNKSFLDPLTLGDEGAMIIRNTGNHSPNKSHSRNTDSSSTPL
jgi:hypothetical protein